MKTKEVILVDEQDQPIGTMEKLAAHREGRLHRAFSIFIFNKAGEMLLQRRALEKYHSGGLWTNACCSHPEAGDGEEAAARRRLQEEMGFDTGVTKIFDFIYRADFENGLIEYEFDHVFAGEYDGAIAPDPSEVMDYRYQNMADINKALQSEPERFSAWFRLAFPRVRAWWMSRYREGISK